MSGLDLRHREAALKGGTRGPSIVPGNPAQSLLLTAVLRTGDLKMPPGKEGLSETEIATLRKWIQEGAAWEGEAKKLQASWWSFRKPQRPNIPRVANSGWVRNPVDAFILARLEQKGLKPAPPADRRTLARRLYFDLIGLPPTPEQLESFLDDKSPEAYEKLVDTLLASPHYGERWGRHWLDVVRYADTGGYQTDLYYKDAWRYRDYVIHSLNEDKPYDRFVQEQIAGDELWPDNLDLQGSYYIEKKKLEHMEARLGTGLYTISPVYHESGLDVENYFDMQWTDWVDTTSSVFLGLTAGCARCHDHKFDPISQRDYFGLRAIFAGSDRTEIPLVHRMDLFDQWQFYPKHVRVQQLRAAIEKLLERPKRAVIDKMMDKFSPEEIAAYETPEEKRTEDQRKLATKLQAALSGIREKQIEEQMTSEEREKRDDLIKQVGKAYLETVKPMSTAMVLGHLEIVPDVYLLKRGDYRNKGEKIGPALPAALSGEDDPPIDEPAEGPFVPQRRKALALWATKPDHPLTARVMVNRIWQGHFGRGIVGTPNDFGRQGEAPTHPELLDWLATEFVARKWSMKEMHRLMVLSNTYRMSSRNDDANQEIDPRNLLLWRMNPRRLEAEAIWDSVLSVAGTLTAKLDPMRYLRNSNQENPGLLNPMGGPPVFPSLSEDEMAGGDLLDKSQWPVSIDPRERTRRAVYIYVKRSFGFPMFTTFDAPDSALSCGRRQSTTVAPQSLALMNGEMIQSQALALAARLIRERGDDATAWVERAWMLALGRRPSADELRKNLEFLELLEKTGGDSKWTPDEPGSVPAVRAAALAKLCLALFNLNEFLYVD
jgi:hypothetical protein